MVSRNVSASCTIPPRNEQFRSRKSAQIPWKPVAYKSAQVATSDNYVCYKIKWK